MVTFKKSFAPVSAKQIACVEEALSVILPADYKRFLRTTNGGVPTPDCFNVPDRGDALCGILYGIRQEGGPADLQWEQERANEWDPLPRAFIAIGQDPGGNSFLLATTGKQAGNVFFWDRRGLWVRKDGQNTFQVAKCFTDFIAGFFELPTESKAPEAPIKRAKRLKRAKRRRTRQMTPADD